MEKLRLFLFRFIIIGLTGVLLEMSVMDIYQLVSAIYAHGIQIVGDAKYQIYQFNTNIFAFFVYCWAAIPLGFLVKPLQKHLFLFKTSWLNAMLRGALFGLIFMTIEFCVGVVCVYVLGFRPWNYSDLPLNILGLTTFTFYPVFAVYGMMGEWFEDRLEQIDDMVLNPSRFQKK